MKMLGEDLIIKMWESLVDKGIGGILRPWHEQRLDKQRLQTRRAEMLLIAQTELDVKKIASGEAVYCSDGSVKLLADNRGRVGDAFEKIEPDVGDISVVDLAVSAAKSESVKREINVAKAIMYAETELSSGAEDSVDEDIDGDWIFAWREYAGRVSSEELQALWGKVLAGEVKKPGTYSMRTLEFLKCLSRGEAEVIERVARFVITNAIAKNLEDFYKSKGVVFKDFLLLQNLGLIAGVESLGLQMQYSSRVSDRYVNYMFAGAKIIIIEDSDASKMISIPAYSVTPLGLEVFRLSGVSADLDYVEEVARLISQQVSTVKIADFVPTGKEEGNYFNERLVKPLSGDPAA
ncbi:DUF2806 domain-containing protein [Pseudomonas sp. D(2018)]|uniref:DUF2806 domain-containing protein n=1 Tax=Pseudomonas sp. D(2018) TaxID=2502238 RepID=UPI0010F7BAAC|nr:DUF2806 domain-containing protein [Pseudomonas sp. D(2018)]